ncbi:MAG: hypothetical protein HC828_20015 [Blastochloris sp.]|nr:hypothetical protein [Blastochloris sp.]
MRFLSRVVILAVLMLSAAFAVSAQEDVVIEVPEGWNTLESKDGVQFALPNVIGRRHHPG